MKASDGNTQPLINSIKAAIKGQGRGGAQQGNQVNQPEKSSSRRRAVDVAPLGRILRKYGYFDAQANASDALLDEPLIFSNPRTAWGAMVGARSIFQTFQHGKHVVDSSGILPTTVAMYSKVMTNFHLPQLGALYWGKLRDWCGFLSADFARRSAAARPDEEVVLDMPEIIELATATANKIMRTIAATKIPDALMWIGQTCGIPDFHRQEIMQMMSVELDLARTIAMQCLRHQKLLDGSAAEPDRDPNGPKRPWSATHNAVAFGSLEMLELVLKREGPQLQHQLNPLEVAVTCGWAHLVAPLLAHGYSPAVEDLFGRNPIDIACMQRWSEGEIVSAFGASSYQRCISGGVVEPKNDRLIPAAPDMPPDTAPPASAALPYDGTAFTAAGGWGSSSLNEQPPSHCDFDVRVGLTPLEFARDYASVRRPVLMRGGQVGAGWDELREKWRRDAIAANHPHLTFQTSHIVYGKKNGMDAVDLGIADYLQYVRDSRQTDADGNFQTANSTDGQYIFEAGTPVAKQKDPELWSRMQLPSVIANAPDGSLYLNFQPHFYLGPPGTGAPMHNHRNAFNALVYGRKRWVVMPQRFTMWSLRHINTWLDKDYRRLKDKYGEHAVLDCIQEPGDIMYVPKFWAHGVLNLAESVGYAMEFDYAQSALTREARDQKQKNGKGGGESGGGKQGSRRGGRHGGESAANTDVGENAADLSKLRIKVLRKMLKEAFNDECKGCLSKAEFVEKIMAHRAAGGGGGGGSGKDEL